MPVGAALACGVVGLTLMSWWSRGGSFWPEVALVLACVAAFTAARAVGARAPWLPPGAIAVAGVSVALVHHASLIGDVPLNRPFRYANAEAAFFALATIAAMILAFTVSAARVRRVAVAVSLGLGFVSVASGSITVAILLPVLTVAALVSTRAGSSGRTMVRAFAVAFATVLLGTTLIAAAPRDVPFSTTIGQALTDRRIELWHDAWRLLVDHPITGTGPGTFPAESPTARSDSDTRLAHHEFLEQGAELGVPGYLLASALTLWVFAAIAAKRRVTRVETLSAAATCLIATHACVDYVLHVPAVAVAGAVLAGAGLMGDRGVESYRAEGNPMHENAIDVVYIGGHARTGSTILHRILGLLPGAVAVGEVVAIDRVLLRNAPCGCGAPIRECPFWSAVLTEAFGGVDAYDVKRMIGLRRDLQRTRRLPRALRRSPEGLSDTESEFVDVLDRLYAAIRRVSGCNMVVDSSKDPVYAALLALAPGVRMRFVHLVRDSRAVAYSEQQARVVFEATPQQSSRPLYARSPFRSATSWMISEAACAAVGRRYDLQRLRYEDFVADPERELRQLLPRLGRSAGESPVEGHWVNLPAVHTVIGNPNRFTVGRVLIQADRKWEAGLSSRARRVVDLVTWPLLRARGYRIRLARTSAAPAGQPAKSEE